MEIRFAEIKDVPGILALLRQVGKVHHDLRPDLFRENAQKYSASGVLALLVKSLWTMYKKSPKGWAAYVVMACAFVLTAFCKLNVLIVIIFCAVFGLVTSFMAERRAKA